MRTVGDPIPTPGRAGQVDLIAGELCLDFANTVEPRVAARHGGQPREYLTGYHDLIAWAEHAGIVDGEEARHLRVAAEERPAEAAAAVRDDGGGRRIVPLGGGGVIDSAKAITGADGRAVAAVLTTLSGAPITRVHRMPAGLQQRTLRSERHT